VQSAERCPSHDDPDTGYLLAERIESRILLIPGHKVMLDGDLAGPTVLD
jgi:hypothetical protein